VKERQKKQRENPRSRLPLFRSVKVKTAFVFLGFALGLLVLLWTVFAVFLFGVYDKMIKSDLEKVGDEVSELCRFAPSKIEPVQNAEIMSEIARRESVAMAIFTIENGEYNAKFTIDTFGNVTEGADKAFGALMAGIKFDRVFVSGGGIDKTATTIGTFLCYGNKLELETSDGGKTDGYLLIAQSYDVINSQTASMILVLVICTVIVIAAACVISVLLSRYQTRLLTDFSGKAKRLAEGDYGIEFSGGGYEEYDNLATALNTAKDEINKTETMRRDMISNVSHDIRTPLTMIRAYAEMLRDMPVDVEKRQKNRERDNIRSGKARRPYRGYIEPFQTRSGRGGVQVRALRSVARGASRARALRYFPPPRRHCVRSGYRRRSVCGVRRIENRTDFLQSDHQRYKLLRRR